MAAAATNIVPSLRFGLLIDRAYQATQPAGGDYDAHHCISRADATMRKVRTKITLDPDVQELVERVIRERRLSFKSVINQALREALGPKATTRPIRTLKLEGPRPGVDLHRATQLAAMLEDDELARKLELRK